MKKPKQLIISAAIFVSLAAITVLSVSTSTLNEIVEKLSSEAEPFLTINDEPHAEPPTSSVSYLDSFHFLEPLAPRSGDPTRFDSTLLNSLSVEVCEVSGSSCPVVKTFTAQDTSAERLRIETTPRDGSYYIANWDTLRVHLNDKTYRVRVSLGELQLGSIDLSPAVYTRFGRTWPIKFLIEKDPILRVRHLRSLGRSASQITSVLRNEFGLSAEQIAELLANDLEPFSAAEIEIAIDGVFQAVIIPHTTKVSDETTRNALISFNIATGRMLFFTETPILRDLNIGDVLVSEPSDAAPYGYLRKVTSIRRDRTQIVLETVQAKINQAVSKGTLKAAGELLPRDVATTSATAARATSRNEAEPINGLSRANVGDGFNFRRDIDVTIELSGSGGGTSGTGTVRVQGFIDFNAGYDMGFGIETCTAVPPVCVDRVEAHVNVNQKSNIRVTGTFDGMVHKEKVIDTIHFDPITFFIGPIPVVILPVIDVIVGIDGQAHLDFRFAAEASSILKLGAKWTDPDDGGQGWQDIRQFTPLVGQVLDANLNANLKVEGYGKANAKLLLYGIAGPGVGGRIGLGAEVRLGQSPLWKIYGHLVGDVNFSVDIGGVIDLDSYSHVVLDESFQIGQAANQPPRCTGTTDTIQAQIGVPKTLGPRSGFEGHFECMDPEGGSLTYSAVSSILSDGANGVIANNAGIVRYAFQSPGPRTIIITARDPSGGTADVTLTVDVRNSLPIVTINGASTIAATVQYFATASAYDPDTNSFLGCNRLAWQVTAPDSLTLTGSGGTCGATIRFNAQGTRTVMVTATDLHGGVGSNSIAVNVTAPPANSPPEINFFAVYAYRGPFEFPCEDPNYLCLIPNNYTIYNGFPTGFVPPQTGEYYPPLYLDVGATDPNGTIPTVTWTCKTGTTPAAITWDSQYGYLRCDPIASNEFPVVVKVVVSDGVTSVERQHSYRMFVGPR